MNGLMYSRPSSDCGCPTFRVGPDVLQNVETIHYETCEFHDAETCMACAEEPR